MGADHEGVLLGNTGVARTDIKDRENEVTSNVHEAIEEKESGKGL